MGLQADPDPRTLWDTEHSLHGYSYYFQLVTTPSFAAIRDLWSTFETPTPSSAAETLEGNRTVFVPSSFWGGWSESGVR